MKLRYLASAGALVALVPQAAMAEIVISPRVSYFFDNINQRSSGLDDAAEPDADELAEQNQQLQDLFGPSASIDVETQSTGVNSDQIALPMFGLAGTYIDGDWSYTLTAMYGEASGTANATTTGIQTFSVFGETATDVISAVGRGTQDARRIDLELTAQKRLNERFAVMGGVRYENVDTDFAGAFDITTSNNFENLVGDIFGAPPSFDIIQESIAFDLSGSYEVYSVRGGVAGFIPFGENNTVFLNGMLHLSHEPSPNLMLIQDDIATGETVSTATSQRSETTLGPDVSVGVQFGLGGNASFDIRYRGAFYFPLSGGKSFNDPRVNHGVNAGISFLF